MRLLSLDLIAFGAFTDHHLDLAAGRQGLHIVYGPNEAGKTTTLRALTQTLYSIPHRSDDAFLHDYKSLRLGATLQHSDGRQLTFQRRKGKQNTLLDASGETPLRDDALDPFLSGITQTAFENRFGIDRQKLIDGGSAVVQGHGELGELLFMAGSGLTHLRKVQSQFRQDAERLFKPTGTNPLVNKKLTLLGELHETLRQQQLSGDEWSEAVEGLKADRLRKTELEAELDRLHRERDFRQRVFDHHAEITEYRGLLTEWETLSEVNVLRDDFADEVRTIDTDLRIAENNLRADIERRSRAVAEREAITVDDRLLTQRGIIEQLVRDLGKIQKADSDTPERTAEREQLSAQARQLLADVLPSGAEIDIDTFSCPPATRSRMRSLAKEHAQLIVKRETIEETLRETTRRRAELEAKCATTLEANPEAETAVETLEHLSAEIERHGAIEIELEELTAAHADEEANWNRLGRELPLVAESDWQRIIAEPLPEPERIEEASEERERLRSTIESDIREVERLEGELRTVGQKLNALKRAGELLTDQDLSRHRGARDRLWRSIREAWLLAKELEVSEATTTKSSSKSTGKKSRAASSFDFDDERDNEELAEKFESEVQESDRISDRLRETAEELAEHRVLSQERDVTSERLTTAKQKLKTARQTLTDWEASWEAEWQPLGITPKSPREMRGWRKRAEELRTRAATLADRQREIDRMSSLGNSCRERLTDALANCGEALPNENGDASLAELLSRAATVVQASHEQEEHRSRLASDRERLTDAIAETEAAREANTIALQTWEANWETVLSSVGLGSMTPDVAEVVLETLETFEQKRIRIRDLDVRLEGMAADRKVFTEELRSFAREYTTDLETQPEAELVAELQRRLRQNEERQATRDRLGDAIDEANTTIDDIEREVRNLTVRKQSLLDEAGCATAEELPETLRRSNEAKSVRERKTELERLLLTQSAGRPVAEFLTEAATLEVASLPREIETRTQRIAETKTQRDELISLIATRQADLDRLDGSAEAARTADRIQNELADIEHAVAEYARAQLATTLLKRSVDRYREKHHGAVLSRAGELFARLTLGSFERLKIDFDDDDQQILVGVRADRSTVPISGMSEGSADQLYLALRIASLEEYLTGHEPMPFVIDDILQTFDNERSRAALEIFAELSTKTQVIFLTHHEHLTEIAREALSDDVLFVHPLHTV